MPVISTPNRSYSFPETDVNLESSNGYLRFTIFKIDTDIQDLYDNKSDKGVSYTKQEVDILLSEKDIYGDYTTGDVRGKTELNLKTDTFDAPGWYSKIEINNKGLVIGHANLAKADIINFTETEYVHTSGNETIAGDKTFTGQVNLSGGAAGLGSSVFDDTSTTSTEKGWTANKLNNNFALFVPLTSYKDSDVLAKLLNVDGSGSLLDSDKLDGQEGVYYLDFPNFTNLPTTAEGYGITPASIKASYESNADTNGITDAEKVKIVNLPNDTATAIDNINAILASDDTTLDEIQEIVNYIKQNKNTLDTLGISNIAGLQTKLDDYDAKLASNDTTLDTVQEIVDFIKQERTDIDTNTASISDINTKLASNDTTLDTVQEIVDFIKQERTDIDTNTTSISDINTKLVKLEKFEDFEVVDSSGNSIINNFSYNIISGASYSPVAVSDFNSRGIIKITSSTTADSGVIVEEYSQSLAIQNDLEFESRISVIVGADCYGCIGFYDNSNSHVVSSSSAPTSGVYFEISGGSASGNLILSGGSLVTTTSSATLNNNEFYKFIITTQWTGTSGDNILVTFKILDSSGTEVLNETIQDTYDTATNGISLGGAAIALTNTTTTAEDFAQIDYIKTTNPGR